MKILTKLTQTTAAVLLLASMVMAGGQVFAQGNPGQIEGGNNNYLVQDVTQGTGFANPQSANACDILLYRLHLYNPGPSGLTDVKVETTVNNMNPYSQYGSTASVYTPDGVIPVTYYDATVNFSTPQTQTYVKDSTVLLDNDGNVISSSANGTLPDTITDGAGGIDIGNIGESVTEYLEFKTQVNCPTPPAPAVCNTITPPVIDGDTATISNVDYAPNGAKVSSININWGDGTTTPYPPSDFPGSVSHTYSSAANTYTISATLVTSLGNVTSQGCTTSATIVPPTTTTTPPPTPTAILTSTPTTPAQLVNTGPGDVVGLFAGTALLAGVGRHLYKTRKFANFFRSSK
jgi:hypothetical protein